MSRVYQSLLRAQREGNLADARIHPNSNYLKADSDAVSERHRREPVVASPSPGTLGVKEHPGGDVGLRKCRRCKRVDAAPVGQPKGFRARMLSVLRVKPFRCAFCGNEFHAFAADGHLRQEAAPRPSMLTTFLPVQDSRGFEELVEDMLQSERELFEKRQSSGGHGALGSSDQGTEERDILDLDSEDEAGRSS